MAADARFGEQDFGEWHGLTHDALAAAQATPIIAFGARRRSPPARWGKLYRVIARVGAALTEWTAPRGATSFARAMAAPSGRLWPMRSQDLAPERALQIMADNLSRTAVDYVAPTAGFDGAWRVLAVNLPAVDGQEGIMARRKFLLLIAVLSVALVALVGSIWATLSSGRLTEVVDVVRIGGDFELTDHTGRRVTAADFKYNLSISAIPFARTSASPS